MDWEIRIVQQFEHCKILQGLVLESRKQQDTDTENRSIQDSTDTIWRTFIVLCSLTRLATVHRLGKRKVKSAPVVIGRDRVFILSLDGI